MAAGGNVKGQAKSCQFFSVLSAAVCEWYLIIFLLINAVLAYVATRFARLCNLPTPCLLCSRLDHILGSERRGFYRNLFCHAHKVEISSLVYCHGHGKLADFRDMCNACLLSSVATKKANSETCRMLGRNGQDLDDVGLLNEDLEPASSGTGLCSCCSESFNLHRLLQAKKKKKKKLEAGIPNPRPQLRKRTVGHNGLMITSDSESAMPVSDDDDDDDGDDGHALRPVTKDIKEERVIRPGLPQGTATIVLEDTVPEKLIHPNPVASQHPILDPERRSDDDDSCDKPFLKSTVAIGHKLDDLSRGHVVEAGLVDLSESTPEQAPREITDRPSATYPGVRKVSSTNSLTSQTMNDSTAATRSVLDHNDSFKYAINNKGIMLSPKFSEIIAGKESSRGQEDLKLRLSRAFDLPWSDIIASPRAEDLKYSDVSSSFGLQNIAKRLSVERNNSSLETFDASIVVSDIEGETSVDRLKRQIELDRKCMSALYKELDEERSASTIAANEAMAMINRLQEEKAAMQMEAFQYLRMMEEQAEYDQEAIHKLNDVINERDKELLDLEAEFERYRRRHRGAEPEDKRMESVGALESTGFGPATTPRYMESRELLSPASTRRRTKSLCRSMSEKIIVIPQEGEGEGDGHGVKDLELGFEEEKVHILACLRRLQDKFSMLPTDKVRADDTIVDSEKENLLDGACTSVVDVNLETSRNGVEVLPENGSSPSRTCSGVEATTTAMDNQFPAERQNTSDACRDMNSVQDEVARLIKRMVELDADREFLGHTMNALNYGNDGVLLVQEIACQLKELRRIPLAAKEPNVA
ncbi:hypothetical protein B296_00028616 [Ensete ventricosum]|uniref:GTD-binding domain-containing protein n=1 Tax=Ensete ventricosum TaxID=4639 RepID=A0A427AME5_ENSVE|nr:hypothetical protein B296_00028616 [Ensete ventricosum]